MISELKLNRFLVIAVIKFHCPFYLFSSGGGGGCTNHKLLNGDRKSITIFVICTVH